MQQQKLIQFWENKLNNFFLKMKVKNLINKNNFYIVFILIFSTIINQYYASLGAFPLDTFYHFDLGYRILQGDVPFTDIWMVSGVFVNYIQALFFFIFGTNWTSYVLHASVINSLISLGTYFLLRDFGLKTIYCFFYSLLFSLLAYTSSGTPFVDHQSAFFCLLGIYSLLFAIKKENPIFWILIPIFLGFGFLSKQVPAFYIFVFSSIIITIYLFNMKKIKPLRSILFGIIIFIFFVFCVGFVGDIKFNNFIQQYILYPQSIGNTRFSSFEPTFRGIVGHFKFIYISMIPFVLINLKKIIYEKKYLKKRDFFYFIIIFFFTLSLIFHQFFTKNQTFIFFLIPLLVGFSHIAIESTKIRKTNLIPFLLVFYCALVTTKYHLRLNEERKFHELNQVNFSKSISATKIDQRLKGLKWITNEYKDNVQEEIDYINKIKNQIKSDRRNKMVITHYSFLSSILKENLFSPSMAYTSDGSIIPLKNNKYAQKYKNLVINLIKKNNLDVIYIIYPVHKGSITDYLDNNCFNEKLIFKGLVSYEIKRCKDLKGKNN